MGDMQLGRSVPNQLRCWRKSGRRRAFTSGFKEWKPASIGLIKWSDASVMSVHSAIQHFKAVLSCDDSQLLSEDGYPSFLVHYI